MEFGNETSCEPVCEEIRAGSSYLDMFITTAIAIYSLGHGLQTLTALPRSTQLFTLRGTAK